MSQEKEHPDLMLRAQIAVAVIGLVGSLGGAWIASGAKFDRELASRGEEINELKRALAEAREKLDAQQAKIDRLDSEIEYAKKATTELGSKAAEIAWQKIKSSWFVGRTGSGAEK